MPSLVEPETSSFPRAVTSISQSARDCNASRITFKHREKQRSKQRKAEDFLKQRDGGTEMFEGQRMASEVCMGFA